MHIVKVSVGVTVANILFLKRSKTWKEEDINSKVGRDIILK